MVVPRGNKFCKAICCRPIVPVKFFFRSVSHVAVCVCLLRGERERENAAAEKDLASAMALQDKEPVGIAAARKRDRAKVTLLRVAAGKKAHKKEKGRIVESRRDGTLSLPRSCLYSIYTHTGLGGGGGRERERERERGERA